MHPTERDVNDYGLPNFYRNDLSPIGHPEIVTFSSDDPFDQVILDIHKTNHAKRADYAKDDDPFSNFRDTAAFANFEYPWLSALFNCAQKLARVRSLTKNGRINQTQNEAIEDTLLDNAVYAIIALAIYRQGKSE